MCNTSEDFLHYDYVRLAWDIGFTFEEYDAKTAFDFSLIGLVDVDRVAKDRDIPTVVKHIPTLLSFRLDNDIGKVLEPNFVKLFRLAQLSIQYLRFCKRYLDSTVALLKNELIALQGEKDDMELYMNELREEHEATQRKYHELKATLSTNVFKCEECTKTFYSEEYLLAHVKRRHETPVMQAQMQTEADRLQLEIKELKQRLNNTEKMTHKEDKETEKELESVEPNNDDAVAFEDSIQFKFEQLKSHIESEINSLKDEDFYRGICERFIKERVDKKLSVITHQGPSIKDGEKIDAEAERAKAIESSTQTDVVAVPEAPSVETISEGTCTSPQASPRTVKPFDDGDHRTIGANDPDECVDKAENENSMKTIERKLQREVELQRETLEQVLDLKLSGSLNKMEAQMNAFWEKLNAWESNLAKPSIINASHTHEADALPIPSPRTEITQPVQVVERKEIAPSIPQALPRKITAKPALKPPNASPKRVGARSAPPAKTKAMIVNDVKSFLLSESSEDETNDATVSGVDDSESVSDVGGGKSLKPSESFKKRLDEALLQRLKAPTTVNQTQVIQMKPPKNIAQLSTMPSREYENGSVTTDKTESESERNTTQDSDQAEVKQRHRPNVEESLNQKLKDIGISPHWQGLPEKSFKKAMEIVEHQASLSKKTVSDFQKIKKKIEQTIDKEIEKKNQQRRSENAKNKRSVSRDNLGRALAENSPDIPLQRTAARQLLTASRTSSHDSTPRSSFSIDTSPTKETQIEAITQQVVDVHPIQNTSVEVIVTETPIINITPTTNMTTLATTTSTTPAIKTILAPPPTFKKKVLFNLDDTESSVGQQSPSPLARTKDNLNLAAYVKNEKSKLTQNKPTSELHTGSDTSDWDISDMN